VKYLQPHCAEDYWQSIEGFLNIVAGRRASAGYSGAENGQKAIHDTSPFEPPD
jgi:hypothetical protein